MATWPIHDSEAAFARAIPSDRARLVRLCARLTGDLDAAEDLAQETLYEAWRNAHKLRGESDADGRARWLAAIARNVCLRWARSHGADLAHRATAARSTGSHPDAGHLPALDDYVADEFDVEVELERHELVRLLDRAMGLLPPATRRVLLDRYISETPQAETALRLGLSEGAVAMRLQRGKLALRHLLTTEFVHEAAAFGLFSANDRTWQETRMWCPLCGARHLLGIFDHDTSTLLLRCPSCQQGGELQERTQDPRILGDVKGYRPAYSRVLAFVAGYYQRSRRENPIPCPSCGHPVLVRPAPRDKWYGVHYECGRAGPGRHDAATSFSAIVLGLPEGRRFWRDHPRIRLLPMQEVEANGTAACVTRYESLTSGARLEVVATRDTCDLIAVHGAPAPRPEDVREVVE